jgi:GDSL-like Lipase/Acylhydrolase family
VSVPTLNALTTQMFQKASSVALRDSLAKLRQDSALHAYNINYGDSIIAAKIARFNTAQQVNFPLRNFLTKYSDVRAKSANSNLKIAHIGDSNTESGSFENYFKNMVKTKIAQKGAGWVSFNSAKTLVSGVTRSVVGLANKSIIDNAVCGIDMSYAVSTTSTDSCVIGFPNSLTTKDNSTFTTCVIYASGVGNFTVSIDDATPVSYTLTAAIQAYTITVAEERHKIAIRSGAAGQNFYGAAFSCASPSFSYFRLGASGRMYKDYATLDQAALTTQLGSIAPNLILVNLGSNDFNIAATATSIMQNVRTTYEKIRIAAPLADILIIIPSDRNSIAGTVLESEFSDSLTSFALRNRCNFVDLYKIYGYQPEAQVLGLFGDEVHFSAKGHEQNAKAVVSKILGSENIDLWERTGSNGDFAYFDAANLGGVQIGRNSATGGYLDVYNPKKGNILTLQGSDNTYMSLGTIGNNYILLQSIDGSFNRIASSQNFQIYDQLGLRYNSNTNAFTGGGSFSGNLSAQGFTNYGVGATSYLLDFAADAIKKPMRLQNLPAGTSVDNFAVVSAGEFRELPNAKLQETVIKRLTIAQRDALTPVEGIEIYNLTLHKKQFFNGTAWETITSN